MRCSRCGNDNPGLNRFCGMCGATLLAPSEAGVPVGPLATRGTEPTASPAARPAGVSAKPAPAPIPAQHLPEPVRPREIESDSQPIISGPSFLGLNQPGPARGGALGRGSRPDNSPRSLDYLLEDEEEPKGGAGKYVLIVIALVLASGLGYLRWRNEGLDWLTAGMKKTLGGASSETSSPPAANSGGDNSNASNAPAGAANSTTTATANGPAGAAQPGAPVPPAAGGAAAAAPASGGSSNNDAVIPVDSAAAAKTPTDAPANSAADKGTAANPDANATDAGNAASAAAANPKRGSDGKAAANTDDDAENSDDAESAPAAAKPAPLAKPHAAKPLDVVAEGEKYIYGRGVAQDCDRGVKMVRQAANQSNAKAMISLGALYSAGLCAPRDLPTAYRWFAIALRKEPDNDSLQTDLKKLWSEMTPPERQLAIKLSQ